MKYNREEFITLFAKMQDKCDKANKISDMWDEIGGNGLDMLETIGFNWYRDYLTETLEKMYAEELRGRKSEVLCWFIYENDFGRDCGQFDPDFEIKSAGDLYDYLMRG